MKYEFSGETKVIYGIEFKRIKAAKSFGDVIAGDLGGWIQGEKNLSHSGDAWVSGNARVFGDARVSGNAWVSGNARVSGDAWEKSPLYIQGTAYSVCACEKNKIKIGCQVHSFYAWNKNWEMIAKENNFDKSLQREYILYFNLACDLYGKERYKVSLKEARHE